MNGLYILIYTGIGEVNMDIVTLERIIYGKEYY